MGSSNEIYAGLMSGTSLDAIDTVLVRFLEQPANRVELIAAREHPFPSLLQTELHAVIEAPENVTLDTLGRLDRQLGFTYAEAVKALLLQAGTDSRQITAIGNHGQTIRHSPDTQPAFTWQLGDAATIAAECGIPTVGQFRHADIAQGGQGAPLVPAFHHWAFSDAVARSVVVNIGGIANITVLDKAEPPIGFDTGPGNTLLDCWFRLHQAQRFDHAGNWAASGAVLPALLDKLLADPFFARAAPKSTGREYFNLDWLHSRRGDSPGAPQDVQATLSELSAATIALAIEQHMRRGNVWICGGGARNTDLLQRIIRRLPGCKVASTAALGIDPDWVEAIAFAWLARARIHGLAAGIPAATGARKAAKLGCIHLPPEA
jgi:anhydro-N-acetylmuramic acid kinase